jgi:hypothetical protein
VLVECLGMGSEGDERGRGQVVCPLPLVHTKTFR